MNCTVAMDCMEDNLSQSGVAGSARDNPITVDDDSECVSRKNQQKGPILPVVSCT